MTSLSKAWRTEKSVWTAFEQTSWIKGVKFICSNDSRVVRFELWRFDFSQKVTSLSKAWPTANSAWSTFEPSELIVSNLLAQTILGMPNREALVKKWVLFREHAALQSQFATLLNQFLEKNVSNFLLHTIHEMPDSSFKSLDSVQKPFAEVLHSRCCKKKMVHAEQPENRAAYAFWPTNEKHRPTFLVDRNYYHFFGPIILDGNQSFFWHPNAIDETI